MEKDMKISMLKSAMKSTIDELSAIKNEYVKLESEHVSSRKELLSLRNSLRASRDNFNVVEKELLKNKCKMLLARKSIYHVKRKACIFKNKSLLVSDSIFEIKKQKRLHKNKLNAIRKESCSIKEDIKTSLDTLKECKKESVKASEKRKNDRVSQIINDFKRHDKRINQLNAKHCNSTNISTSKRLRNETEEYMNKARKYRDEVLHVVNISNLSNRICINASTQVDIDFDSTKSEVVFDNDSNRDANVSINDDFDDDDDDDSKYLQNVDTNDDSDDDNINDDSNVNTNVNITLDLERVISMNRLNRRVTDFIVKTIRNKIRNKNSIEKMEEYACIVDDLYRSLQDVRNSQRNKIDKTVKLYDRVKHGYMEINNVTTIINLECSKSFNEAYGKSIDNESCTDNYMSYFIIKINSLIDIIDNRCNSNIRKLCDKKTKINIGLVKTVEDDSINLIDYVKKMLRDIVDNAKSTKPNTIIDIKK